MPSHLRINKCLVSMDVSFMSFQPAAEGKKYKKNVFNYSDIRQKTVCVNNYELKDSSATTKDASKCRKLLVLNLNLYDTINIWGKQVNMTKKYHIYRPQTIL